MELCVGSLCVIAILIATAHVAGRWERARRRRRLEERVSRLEGAGDRAGAGRAWLDLMELDSLGEGDEWATDSTRCFERTSAQIARLEELIGPCPDLARSIADQQQDLSRGRAEGEDVVGLLRAQRRARSALIGVVRRYLAGELQSEALGPSTADSSGDLARATEDELLASAFARLRSRRALRRRSRSQAAARVAWREGVVLHALGLMVVVLGLWLGAVVFLALGADFGASWSTFGGMGVAAGCIYLGGAIVVWGRKNRAMGAAHRLRRERRPPCLYLRSFSADEALHAFRDPYSFITQGSCAPLLIPFLGSVVLGTVRQIPELGGRIGHRPAGYDPVPLFAFILLLFLPRVLRLLLTGGWKPSFEEELVRHVAGGVAPVVAVGRPDEELPALGAARIYLPDRIWQEEVARLLQGSSAVVIQVGELEAGLEWEMRAALAQVELQRLLFVFPGVGEDPTLGWTSKDDHSRGAIARARQYARFRSIAKDVLPGKVVDQLPSSLHRDCLFLHFDAQGRPRPGRVVLRPASLRLLNHSELSLKAMLRPFFRQVRALSALGTSASELLATIEARVNESDEAELAALERALKSPPGSAEREGVLAAIRDAEERKRALDAIRGAGGPR